MARTPPLLLPIRLVVVVVVALVVALEPPVLSQVFTSPVVYCPLVVHEQSLREIFLPLILTQGGQ